MHSTCPLTLSASTSPLARRAEFLAQILEPAYTQSSSLPSTSYLTSSLSPSTSTQSTKAYKDCQGVLHDPEWRDFPTEEWKKQRREQRRRTFLPHQSPTTLSRTDSRSQRPSLEYTDDESDLEDEYEYTPSSGWRRSPPDSMRRRRRSEGDEGDEEDVEYAFGGRKNRNRHRYRATGMDTPAIRVHSPEPMSPSMGSTRHAIELERTSTILSDRTPATSTSSSTQSSRKTLRSNLSSLFKRHHHHHQRDPDASTLGFDEFPFPTVPTTIPEPSPTNGLGLMNIDPYPTYTYAVSPVSPSALAYLPPTPSLSTTASPSTASSSLPSPYQEEPRSSFSDSEDDSDSEEEQEHGIKGKSSLSTLRSKAYRRYLALELSITLGVVRTERKLRDWKTVKTGTLRPDGLKV